MQNNNCPQLGVAWTRTSRKNNQVYIRIRLGDLPLTLLPNKYKKSDTDPDWVLYLGKTGQDKGKEDVPVEGKAPSVD